MNDTPPAVDRLYRRMLLNLSPERRVAMACSMFTTAKTLAVAQLRTESPGLHGVELKKALFHRFYGRDFTPEVVERICGHL